MKKRLFSILLCTLVVGLILGQGNATMEGETTTKTIVIQSGAVSGHILQSVDATGLGQWVDPATVIMTGGGDNLGDHTATMNLNMNTFGIFGLSSTEYISGAAFGDDGASGLNFSGNQIDFDGAQLLNARQLTFVTGMGDAFIREEPVNAPSKTEIRIANASGTPLSVGIGGPVNPPASTPIASVLMNAGQINPQLEPFLLGVHGDAWAMDWYAISDERFKKNIKPIRSSLDKIKQIQTVTYQLDKDKFDSENIDESPTIGFLAQDLALIIPEAVKVNSNGVHLVRYNAIIPVLADAIRELDKQVTVNADMENQLTQLQNENSQILKRLAILEAQLSKK